MNEETMQSWGKRVRARRGALTQDSLAELCGTDQSVISRIEHGQLAVSDEMKAKIAGALGCLIEDLFPYPNVRPPFPMPDTPAAKSA